MCAPHVHSDSFGPRTNSEPKKAELVATLGELQARISAAGTGCRSELRCMSDSPAGSDGDQAKLPMTWHLSPTTPARVTRGTAGCAGMVLQRGSLANRLPFGSAEQLAKSGASEFAAMGEIPRPKPGCFRGSLPSPSRYHHAQKGQNASRSGSHKSSLGTSDGKKCRSAATGPVWAHAKPRSRCGSVMDHFR